MDISETLGTSEGELKAGHFYQWRWGHGWFRYAKRATGLDWIAVFQDAEDSEFEVDPQDLLDLAEEPDLSEAEG